MSSRNQDPNEWAAKRKAAVEQARLLREQRKNQGAGAPEDLTFTPQVNKRPGYLNKDSSTAKIDTPQQYRVDPNSPFEQPLPGRSDYNSNNGTSHSGFAPPKSSIIQNAGSNLFNGNRDSSYDPSPRKQQQQQQQQQQQNEADEFFLNNLRSDNSKSGSGPGWNNDIVSSSGFGDPPPTNKYATKATKNPASSGTGTIGTKISPRKQNATPNPSSLGTGSLKTAPAAVANTTWNYDLGYGNNASESNNSGRSMMQSESNNSLGITNQKSRLSLLKSKIRRTEVVRGSSMPPVPPPGSLSKDDTNPIVNNSDNHNAYLNNSLPRTAPVGNDYSNVRNSHSDFQYDQQQQQQYKAPPRNRSDNNGRSLTQDMSELSLNSSTNKNMYNSPRKNNNNNIAGERSPRNSSMNSYKDAVPDIYESDGPDAEMSNNAELMECPDCGRKFNPVPFSKHIKVCQKVFQKQRKVFDSTKMRVADNPELVKILTQKQKEEAKALKKAGGGKAGATAAPINYDSQPVGGMSAADKKAKWKQDSNAFREAMRAARDVTKAIANGDPLPPPVISAPDPSLIPCPHCGRRFNQKAAERHIPQCVNIRAKPSVLKKGAGGGGGVNGSSTATPVKSKGNGRF